MHLSRKISYETADVLQRLYRQSRHHYVRQRAHCLILHRQGMDIEQLILIFSVSQKTIYNWLNNWDERGLLGLYNRRGQGRKGTFSESQKAQLKAWSKRYPRQIKRLVSKAKEAWDIDTSTDTIKRVLKSMHMSWHRFRRSLPGQGQSPDYAKKRYALEHLKQLDQAGVIDLYYLDEAGFSLEPKVPYGWQEIGQYEPIASQRSQQLNVLGFMHRAGRLESYVSEQSITGAVVAHCLDTYFATVAIPTVIVADQAPVHRCRAVQDKRAEWAARDVYLFDLPSYSPELNLIEILWRFMKYQWIEFSAYESWQALVYGVEKILKGFGKEFVINFA